LIDIFRWEPNAPLSFDAIHLKSKIMLKKGDHVKWKFRFGETHGIITKVHTSDFTFMQKQRRASEESPQYEVMSEKTGKSAVHKEEALKKI